MARQNMNPSSWAKNMEVYQNFSLGLNTKASNETLSERELPYLQNVDIADRGTLKRRKGIMSVRFYNSIEAGTRTQGLFRYFYDNGTYKDIVAKNGYLYVDGVKQSISGFSGQLQTTRDMNAAQYKGKLYIATGTKLVEYDGTTFKVVDAYTPTPLEALYVGLNGLASDPYSYITNGVSTVAQLQGVKFEEEYIENSILKRRSIRFGTVNQFIFATAYYSKPSAQTLEFKFEMRNATDKEGEWPIIRDWSTSPEFAFSHGQEGVIQLKVSIRLANTQLIIDEYMIPKYMIKSTKDVQGEGYYSPTLHQCNQIFVYWERLYMYGDPNEKDVLYASDVQNFNYFPIVNTLQFENERKEGISTIARFRDSLIVFTQSTIQVLYGKTPSEWTREMINSAVGCIAPKTVQPVANSLVFLSKEGLYRLKTNQFNDSNMNLEEIDTGVKDLTMIQDSKACAVVFEGQYQIVYPSYKRRMRFYYNIGAWTLDTSDYMNLINVFVHDGTLFAQREDGTIAKSYNGYADFQTTYETIIETKGFSFSEPYHPKKVKEAQIMFEDQDGATSVSVEIFVDDNKVSTSPITIEEKPLSSTDPEEDLTSIHKIRISGKGHYVKARIKHNEEMPLTFVGLGFIFKTKKP